MPPPQVIKLGKTGSQGQPLDVYTNFQQYGLTPRLAGLVRMDVHLNALRPGLQVGRRAGHLKSGVP